MSSIEVLLEVPPKIEEGLNNGTLERVGGVIRKTGSKQVVVWLREGGQISSNPQLTQGLMGGLLGHAGMSSSTIRHIVLRTTVLKTTIAGFTLLMLVNRIRDYFEKQFKGLEEQIKKMDAKSDRDRWIRLSATLDSVRDVAEAEGDIHKLDVPRLNERLNEGRKHILDDVAAVLHEDSLDPEQGQTAQDYLLGAMHVDTMRIRCYLETDEHKMARDRLKECLEDYRERTGVFVHKLLGVHHARYFHELVHIEDLARYIRIEGWLRGKDDVLMDVIKDYRGDFWNQDAIRDIKPRRSLRSRHPKEPTHHLTALTQAELLIENFQRLEGFEGELDAIERLGLKEWEDLNNADVFNLKDDFNIDEHDDYVFLVYKDRLAKAEQLGW